MKNILLKQILIQLVYNILAIAFTSNLKGADAIILRYTCLAICIAVHFIYLIIKYYEVNDKKIGLHYFLTALVILIIGFSFCSQTEKLV